MSQENNANILGKLVFYVDHLEDDFTFYLDALSNSDIKEIKELFDRNAAADDAKKQFSISEQITFTNLTPSKASPTAENALWTRLADATDEAGCYLFSKLQAVATSKRESDAVQKLRTSRKLSDRTRKQLAVLMVNALSAASLADLASQGWLAKLRAPHETEEYWEKLKVGDPRVFTRDVLERAFPQLKWKEEKGRALICPSYDRRYLSVTVRKLKQGGNYKPECLAKEDQHKRKSYLFSVSEYCAPIYRKVFKETGSIRHAQGLLVVTGPTKSLKSEITRGLIHLYLQDKEKQAREKKERKPHLVTFEDPIEMFYAYKNVQGQLCVALSMGQDDDDINYTPRQKPRDAGLLKDALADALRQTPTVFFVGETRSKEEWEVLLDFAATGHLIITTAHAGSLVEAMRKIFEAREVKTAADRGEIANKLLSVVNLKPATIDLEGKSGFSTAVVFPALWRRTTRGVAGLTSDGLSALLPHRSSAEMPSCLGRRWFVSELIRLVRRDLQSAFKSEKTFADVTTAAYKQTTNWDLQGV